MKNCLTFAVWICCSKVDIEAALNVIEAAYMDSLGDDCTAAAGYVSLPPGATLDPRRLDTARQKADMAAMVLQNHGTTRHNGMSRIRCQRAQLTKTKTRFASDVKIN